MDEAARDRVVIRLREIYARCLELRQAGNDVRDQRDGGLVGIDPSQWEGKVPPTRLESVRTAGDGLEYAAWCIGESVAAISGWKALREVYDAFAETVDARGSSWLNHRWSGVSDGKAVWSP